MTDLVVQLTLSNVLMSAVLAAIAYGVHRLRRYPVLAHLLWVLVLVKLVTPPLLSLPVIPGLAQVTAASQLPVTGSSVAVSTTANAPAGAEAIVGSAADLLVPLLLIAWAIGSLIVLAVSLLRIGRFDRLLRRTSTLATPEVATLAANVAWQLELKSVPKLYISSAHLAPMTWWAGRGVRVIIPRSLLSRVGAGQLRWVLAHELAHVKRRDYLVRWLEWSTVVLFWWNPIVWWTRRNLRHDEEVACDALVLERIGAEPRSYARALLNTVEALAGAATRTPAVASGIDAGGSLERRFLAIVSDRRASKAPRWMLASLTSAALVLMTLGVSTAADIEPVVDGQLQPPASDGAPSADPVTPASPSDAAITSLLGEFGPDAVDDPEQFALLGAQIDPGTATPGRRPRAARQASWNKVFIGTPGVDRFTGTRGRDKILGKGGPDALAGRGKHDLIRGGGGDDTIAGGAGPDKLVGGAGADTIYGNSGRDVIIAGRGTDTIDAGRGNDVVRTWRDGTSDNVDCGPGDADRAFVDSTDVPVNCEIVVVRDAAA